MFGGEYGAFQSRDRHFFREDAPVVRELSKIVRVRREHPALRRGRQYLRPMSGDGITFGLPRTVGGQSRSVVPWSRLFDDTELLLALNTDPDAPRAAWVTIDARMHRVGDGLRCLYSTDASEIGRPVVVRREMARRFGSPSRLPAS